MKQSSCSQEEAVARAVGAGTLPETLAAHAKECAICRDVAQTARWMQALESSPFTSTGANVISPQAQPLPDPGLIWRRAHLDVQHAPKIGTVLEWVQIASAAVASIGLAGWVAWNWYPIEAMAEQFLLNTWPQLAATTYVLASLTPAALTVAALALGYPLLAGE